jgi:hypothetical protein
MEILYPIRQMVKGYQFFLFATSAKMSLRSAPQKFNTFNTFNTFDTHEMARA